MTADVYNDDPGFCKILNYPLRNQRKIKLDSIEFFNVSILLYSNPFCRSPKCISATIFQGSTSLKYVFFFLEL